VCGVDANARRISYHLHLGYVNPDGVVLVDPRIPIPVDPQ
jgi:hypothetical protein